MTWLSVSLGLAGLIAGGWLIHAEGAAIGRVLAGADGAPVAISFAFHAVPVIVTSEAWRLLLPGATRPGWHRLFAILWLREAVNFLLPVARVGGEIVSVRLLRGAGVRLRPAVASTVVETTLSALALGLFAALGVALAATRGASDAPPALAMVGGLVLALAPIALFVAVQRIGLFGLLARIGRAIGGAGVAGITAGAGGLDRAVALCWRRRDRIAVCFGLQIASWALGAGEVWFAARALGHPITLADAVAIEALVQAAVAAAFLVPAGLGVQEAAFLFAGRIVGLPDEAALALAILRRARDLALFLPALAVWQTLEWRAIAGRRRTPQIRGSDRDHEVRPPWR